MARNPYQMDPFLQQGFSNLTKALIGDAETDYQVARTNRVNELLPLEKQQIQANIAVDNARQTLLNAQTLTEDQLRDPRVQTELARAKQLLSAAGKDDALGGLYNAQTQTENELRTPRVNSENANTASINAQTESRLADAMLTEAQTQTENELRTPRVNTQNAQTSAYDAQAAERNASAQQTTDLTSSMIAENEAKAGQYDSEARRNDALARKAEAEAKAATDVKLKPGDTLVYLDDNGQRQTLTADQTLQVDVEEGEEVTVLFADGRRETFKGPPKTSTNKPSDNKTALETVDAQIAAFTEAEDFGSVPQSVIRKMRSKLTAGTKDMDGRAAAEAIQQQLSQTYDGQNVVVLQDGLVDGPAFGVPAYILNFVQEAMVNGRTPSAEAIAKEYGFSKAQAQAILEFAKG